MAETLDAWERIKLYAYQHAHPDDTERIRADVEEIEGLLDGRPVTGGTARTPAVEALTQIRALCDEADRLGDPRRRALTTGQVRAVLDAVSVDATPAQGIDRTELEAALDDLLEEGEGTIATWRLKRYADRILALVGPVEGVALSREEAELAAPALRNAAARHATASGAAWHALAADLRALAARLEAAS